MMEQLVAASELQMLPSVQPKCADAPRKNDARRKNVARFLKKEIKAGLRVIKIGEHGDRQFNFDDLIGRLPEPDQEVLNRARAARIVPVAPVPAIRSEMSEEQRALLWEKFENASDKERRRAGARAQIAREVNDEIEQGQIYTAAYEIVGNRHGVSWGKVKGISERVRGVNPKGASVHAHDYAAALLDGNHGRARNEYGPRWHKIWRSDYLNLNQPTAAASLEVACAIITGIRDPIAARRAGHRVPTTKTLLDRLNKEVPAEMILFKRKGSQAVESRHYVERDYKELRAGQAFNCDGHLVDWHIRLPNGKETRHIVFFGFQDLFSGVMLGWRLDVSENADLVRLAAGDAFQIALCDDLYVDNTYAAATKWLTGQTISRFRYKHQVNDVLGLFNTLGIRVHFVLPYSGRSKRIERAWGDIESHLRARPELDGAWTGNSVATKPENLGTRAVDLAVFESILREEVVAFNQRQGRDTPVAAGRSYQQCFDDDVASGRAVIRRATREQLRLTLLAAEKVTVSTKDNCVHLFGNRFGGELIDELTDSERTNLVARFDPAKLQDSLHIYNRAGRHLGDLHCIAAIGFSDHESVREMKRLKKRRRDAINDRIATEDLIDAASMGRMLPRTNPPTPAAPKIIRPFRSPIEAPRATEPEIFDSGIDIYDDEKVG